MKKRNSKLSKYKHYIFPALILILMIVLVMAAINPGHNSVDVCIKIDGTERNLQYAIDNGLLNSPLNVEACSSSPSGGHNADEIIVGVDGSTYNLVDAFSSGSGLCSSSPTTPDTSSMAFGHSGEKIELSSGDTLQEYIDDGMFCCVDECSYSGSLCDTSSGERTPDLVESKLGIVRYKNLCTCEDTDGDGCKEETCEFCTCGCEEGDTSCTGWEGTWSIYTGSNSGGWDCCGITNCDCCGGYIGDPCCFIGRICVGSTSRMKCTKN
jgi:hypothetical protein